MDAKFFRLAIGLCLIAFSLVFLLMVIGRLPIGDGGYFDGPTIGPGYYKGWLLAGIGTLIMGFLILTVAWRGMWIVVAGIGTIFGAMALGRAVILDRFSPNDHLLILLAAVFIVVGAIMSLSQLGKT